MGAYFNYGPQGSFYGRVKKMRPTFGCPPPLINVGWSVRFRTRRVVEVLQPTRPGGAASHAADICLRPTLIWGGGGRLSTLR